MDSSTIVALMQAQSTRPVRTFSIGFPDWPESEAECAKAVASHLRTDHTELYVTPQDALDLIPALPTLYDEPFADSSQIPTHLVARLARREVTVALSGDAGDELFAGYVRHVHAPSIWRAIQRVPRPLRALVKRGLAHLSPGDATALFKSFGPVLPARLKQSSPADKLQKLADLLDAEDPHRLYVRLVSSWQDPLLVVRDAHEPPTAATAREDLLPEDFGERMLYVDTMSYLPDDILTKVDRATMGVSLEARVPYLDHHLVALAWRVPFAMKVRDGQGKWLLRQLLYKHVPPELIERPKSGFGVPVDAWLRGPLRNWAEELLERRGLERDGFLDPEPIHEAWEQHLSGKRNVQQRLWVVLMFQAWLREWG